MLWVSWWHSHQYCPPLSRRAANEGRVYRWYNPFLNKNEGEISRDVCRTFPHHLLFRHKENGGQSILESVLRKVSDNYFGLGYCQGMNYVAGTIMIALVDPELNGYYSDNDTDELQYRIRKWALAFFLVDRSLDTEDIRNQMYEIMSLLIDRLQMVRLWGYGFPDLPLFVFVLRKYLEYS